jgi:tetratricopeptide (TPR) repeat protein
LTFQEQLEQAKALRLAGSFRAAMHLLKNLQTRLEPKQRDNYITFLNELSECLRCLGQYENAVNRAQEALALAEKYPPDFQSKSKALIILGCIHRHRGELDCAEEFLLKGLTIGEKIENSQLIAFSLANLAKVYRQRGELERAEDCCQRNLSLKENIEDPLCTADSLNSLGSIHWQRGELERAEEYYLQSLALWEEIGNPHAIAESRFQLVQVLLLHDSLARATSQVDQLAQLSQTSELEDVAVRHHLAIGLLKLKQGDLRDALTLGWQARSQAEDIPHFGLIYLFTEQEEHLIWCEALLQELEQISKRERLYGTYAESILLQGLLKRSNFDLENAIKLFERAELLADERGLRLAAQRARDEIKRLQKQIERIRQFQKISPEIYEQIQVQEVLGYLQQVRTVVNG